MNNIDLSICIPTYNRAQIVYKLVTDILLCSDPAIEVVVLDNGSTDDTLIILRAIKDERLVICSNGENKGGLYNVVNVINKAKGKYIVFSTDKDHIDFKEITAFKLFLLQHTGLASGYCTFNSTSENEYEIFQQGYQAVNNIAYKGRHPTGYFFNNRLLKSINHTKRFSDYKMVDMFPFEFIHAELCLMGDGAIYNGHIFTLESGEMAAKHKTYNANGKSKEAFFSPEARLKLAINYTNHINTLQLDLRKKKLLMVCVFFHQLVAATIGYKSILINKDICDHYCMECREIKMKELFFITFCFYREYRNSTIALWGSKFVEKINFEFNFSLLILKKMVPRLIKSIKSK
jgi:glycosyltransferase involved in cell wall biosynthesis